MGSSRAVAAPLTIGLDRDVSTQALALRGTSVLRTSSLYNGGAPMQPKSVVLDQRNGTGWSSSLQACGRKLSRTGSSGCRRTLEGQVQNRTAVLLRFL